VKKASNFDPHNFAKEFQKLEFRKLSFSQEKVQK
jgi:hypothetical protein